MVLSWPEQIPPPCARCTGVLTCPKPARHDVGSMVPLRGTVLQQVTGGTRAPQALEHALVVIVNGEHQEITTLQDRARDAVHARTCRKLDVHRRRRFMSPTGPGLLRRRPVRGASRVYRSGGPYGPVIVLHHGRRPGLPSYRVNLVPAPRACRTPGCHARPGRLCPLHVAACSTTRVRPLLLSRVGLASAIIEQARQPKLRPPGMPSTRIRMPRRVWRSCSGPP